MTSAKNIQFQKAKVLQKIMLSTDGSGATVPPGMKL